MPSVAVFGAAGYTGALSAKLLDRHPSFHLTALTARSDVGRRLDDLYPHHRVALVLEELDLDRHAAVDAAVVAYPHGAAAELVVELRRRGVRVVDLSADFRLRDVAVYAEWYRVHPEPALVAEAVYGLPERYRDEIRSADLVANPGCFPTAALLALAPLVREGLVEPHGIVVDAKSGVTGAGRQSGDAYSFVNIEGDFRAYRVLAHQHTPEIARALSRFVPGAKLTFTAHLLPVARGLLATCYARPRPGVDAARVAECLRAAYANAAFVRVVAPGEARLSRVVGTNLACVGASADDDMVVAVGAIDNLLKGAAGQAIQNLNLMNGWDETLGLEHLQRVSP